MSELFNQNVNRKLNELDSFDFMSSLENNTFEVTWENSYTEFEIFCKLIPYSSMFNTDEVENDIYKYKLIIANKIQIQKSVDLINQLKAKIVSDEILASKILGHKITSNRFSLQDTSVLSTKLLSLRHLIENDFSTFTRRFVTINYLKENLLTSNKYTNTEKKYIQEFFDNPDFVKALTNIREILTTIYFEDALTEIVENVLIRKFETKNLTVLNEVIKINNKVIKSSLRSAKTIKEKELIIKFLQNSNLSEPLFNIELNYNYESELMNTINNLNISNEITPIQRELLVKTGDKKTTINTLTNIQDFKETTFKGNKYLEKTLNNITLLLTDTVVVLKVGDKIASLKNMSWDKKRDLLKFVQ